MIQPVQVTMQQNSEGKAKKQIKKSKKVSKKK